MKIRVLLTLAVLLILGSLSFAQTTSNTVTVTVVASPTCTITVTPANYYQGKAATMTFNITNCTVASSSCTATWDSANLPLTYVASPASLTGAVSATMTATLGAHNVILTCPTPVLSLLSPVTLPNGTHGVTYSANLSTLSQLQGGIPPYTFSLSSGSLPTGLALSSSGIVSGTPSIAGSSSFSFLVKDSSGAATLIRTVTMQNS